MVDLHFLRLWDLYRSMLTENRREIADLYFNCDLSLSEIAEQKGVSRQSVSDCLQSCRRQLEEYESRLGFLRATVQLSLEHSFRMTEIGKKTEEMKARYPEAQSDLDELAAILEKDYSEEVARAIEQNKETLL